MISARALQQQVDNLRAQNRQILVALEDAIEALRSTNDQLLKSTIAITGQDSSFSAEDLTGDTSNAHPPRDGNERPG